MRLKSLRIENFRAFRDETIELESMTCLVGTNGAGKSTVLTALNVLFHEKTGSLDPSSLTEEDFHDRDTSKKIRITATFVELSNEATTELKDYVRAGELMVSAVAAWESGSAKVRQVGSRLGIADFAPCFVAQTAGEVKTCYLALRQRYALPDAKTKESILSALSEYEGNHLDQCVPLESDDNFYGIAGNAKLRKYVQYVYVPAVKDAREEQAETKDGALGKLLARTVRLKSDFGDALEEIRTNAQQAVENLLDGSQQQLTEVADALTNRLADWCHKDARIGLTWDSGPVTLRAPIARATVAEGTFQGEISRFGHGFQRAYLLALLHELSTLNGSSAPTLLLACEEPELYQHPPQARHLAQVLRRLSNADSQVIVTTHSPVFVSADFFEGVRVVRRSDRSSPSTTRGLTYAEFEQSYSEATGRVPLRATGISAELAECLRPQLNEIFFARRLVLVEGTEDRAYLISWATLRGHSERMRAEGLEVVAVGGKSNLLQPLIICKKLGIPVHIVFDADGSSKYRDRHEPENRSLIKAAGFPEGEPFPVQNLVTNDLTIWPNELADVVLTELTASLGEQRLANVKNLAMNACGNAPNLKKNSTYISELLKRAIEEGAEVPSLEDLCTRLIACN